MKPKLLIAFVLQCCCVFAQQPLLHFNHITVGNGLSHNKVNCILRDSRGFMWLGTDDGLNRYDGNKFTIYRNDPSNNTTVSGNIITDLLEDQNQILWIATADGGLTKYDYRAQPHLQFKQYRHSPGNKKSIPVNIINKLLQDEDGYLWLATSGFYVLRFNKQREIFETPVRAGTKTALCMAMGPDGMLWVGRQGGGLLKINPRTFQYEADERYNDLYADLPHATVTSLYKDATGSMWYGSWDRLLYTYNGAAKQESVVHKEVLSDDVLSFAEDEKSNLWIGGRYNGLYYYHKATNSYYNYKHDASKEGTVSDNRINCIYTDKKGMIWIGTNRGVSVHNTSLQQFSQLFLPSPNNKAVTVYDFYKDAGQNLWIGTNEGIYLQKAGTTLLEHHPLTYKGIKLEASQFFQSKNGNWYLGTNYSLFAFDPQTFAVTLLPNTEKDGVMNQIIKSHVVSIVEDTIDSHPVLLVSPYGHFLTYYDFTEQRWVSRLDSAKNIIEQFQLKDNLIRRIIKTHSGAIYFAMAKEGLGFWSNHSMPKLLYTKNDPLQKKGLSNNHVFDIAEDKTGNLWLSTFGGGLHFMNVQKNTIHHIAGGNNLLEGIQTDKLGNVWMISNGNLHKYDPVNQSFSSFQLPDIEKTGGVQGRIYKDPEGFLYAAGKGYYFKIDPAQVKETKLQPTVYLTDLKIFNESFSHYLQQNTITLQHNQNYITIEFSAPDFSASAPVQYQYMLEGPDKQWIDIGTESKVSFSNLDGGNYVFKVRASNKPGVWGNNIASFSIHIIPPVWKRWWFYAVCGLVVAGAAYGVYRYRINELNKKQEIRNKIAQDLHDSMGSTLSSISVYSQVAKIYKQQQKEEQLQQTLEKISETSSEMISEMNDIVWAINPRNDHMEVIVQRMESYAKPLLAAKQIQFSFTYDESIRLINLEMTKRKNFYLIFKEAVNNALKYAECKKLSVSISITHHELQMFIQDDGKGFDLSKMEQHTSQSLSGNGLHNMQMRAGEMKGTCAINSSPGNGTEVNLRFPIP